MTIRTLLSKYTGYVVLYSLYPDSNWKHFSGPACMYRRRTDMFTRWVKLVLAGKETYERGQ